MDSPFFKGVHRLPKVNSNSPSMTKMNSSRLMLVGHRFVIVVRFDGDHEGPQVIVYGAGCQCLIGIVACAVDVGLGSR
jgi:hypothetical protein